MIRRGALTAGMPSLGQPAYMQSSTADRSYPCGILCAPLDRQWTSKMTEHRRAPWLAAITAFILSSACSADRPTPQRTAALPLVEATISGIQSTLTDGTTWCRSVVQRYIDRILAYDQPTGLNAIIFVNDNALSRADFIDDKIRKGERLGSLFCVPVLLKDNFDTSDMPTSGGSIALKNSVPPDDAFMVRQLREADAIIVAKTNMAEWAFSPRQTVSSSYGTTANAYDLERVPAGSSGGTASGVAANFGLVGMGSDTGNSIRGPSSHLALFGIRSTLGLTSRDGVIPLAFDRDIAGPMTRTVTDGAKVFNVVAGFDPADSYTTPVESREQEDYTRFLDKHALAGTRIGVLRALVDTEDADPEVIGVFENALAELARAGTTIIDDFEIANLQQHLDNDNFCARFRYDLRQYLLTLGSHSPIDDLTDIVPEQRYSPYIQEGLDFFLQYPQDVHPNEWRKPCPDFEKHAGRQAFLTDVVDAMDDYRVDAVVYPSWTNPPAPLDDAREYYKGDNSQLIAPATGLPAVSVPMGFSYGKWPAGLQILGRPYSEGRLFGLAFAYEQATRHRIPPPQFPELAAERGH